jgi:type I restriction enzyme S subunit
MEETATTFGSLKSQLEQLQENFTKISKECDALKQAMLRQIFE